MDHAVKHPVVRSRPATAGAQSDLTRYVGGTAACLGFALLVLASIPADAIDISLDRLGRENRYIGSIIRPPEEPEERNPDWAIKRNHLGGARGKAHKGESGKMGDRRSKNQRGLVGVKGPADNPDPHLAKTLAEREARAAGVLGIFRRPQASHVASIFGRESALGQDAENALGGLIGDTMVDAYGVNGLGLVGPGRGGGSMGEGTFGIGNLGTIGKCRGPGCGPGHDAGYWRRGLDLKGLPRPGSGPEVTGGIARVRGTLDKEIIRRVIRSHITEIKFCYERELLRRPGLYGRVNVQFTITPTGAVASAAVQDSTVGDTRVEGCITQAVRRWAFPQPERGGVVIVSYPFVLKSAGTR